MMHGFLNSDAGFFVIEDKDGEFMEFFKDSNLYQNYLVSEKFQNNSGKSKLSGFVQNKQIPYFMGSNTD